MARRGRKRKLRKRERNGRPSREGQQPGPDRGTDEMQRLRAATTGDQRLSPDYPISILLGRGLINELQHDAGMKFARLYWALFGNSAEQAKVREQMQAAFLEAALKADSEQREINKVEAASASLFVAGWRPAVGWLCVATLFYQWVVVPTVSWLFQAAGVGVPPLPHLDSQDTQTLLYALLGVGGLRTIDKMTGTDTVAVALGSAKKMLGGAK